ncbi:hypothetical protein [Haladaptatus sp. CMAA 1911]|uniref:hypothetical protein n=1 Tax=unclassified Haladaptatus TaxID=2622732 RepID=UPI0037542F07
MIDQHAVLAFKRGDPIQIHTGMHTLIGVVYQCDHYDPVLTCRGPEPGEHVLYVVTPTNDRYRVQYCYYEEYDHTQTNLDRYGQTPTGRYAWLRTNANVQDIDNPTDGEQA